MGNLCSRSANRVSPTDHFATPGRTVGSAGAGRVNPRSAAVPSQAQGRTLGSASSGGDDPRTAAAKAAE
ncbi:MAG: hypothetical protein Q9201_007678, partial [Fulgogasparrea decipioides]